MGIRCIITFLVLCVSCSHPGLQNDDQKSLIYDPIRLIKEDHKGNFQVFTQQLKHLDQIARLDRFILSDVQSALSKTRIAYKKIEYLLDYYEPVYTGLYINGAPLNKTHKESSEIDFIPPNGLQTLDELLFSDEADIQKEVIELTANLLESVLFISENHLTNSMKEAEIMEAIRSGLIRSFTLGVTGFDTPGSGQAIIEAKSSFIALKAAIKHFDRPNYKDSQKIFSNIIKVFDEGISKLDSRISFNDFDRMDFLKKVINPLYEDIRIYQESIHIPLNQVISHAQNYSSSNLSDENFLNTDYYSAFSYKELNNGGIIALGKTLFYDPILSRKMDMSCATCHDPSKAFADGLPTSITNHPNKVGKRNSPTLIDAGYATRFFWDMREYDLERQISHVLEDSLEFNFSFSEVQRRLVQSEEYVHLFNESYGDIALNPINRRSISNAVAAYVNSLVSFDSPFDQYIRGEVDHYSEDAASGFNLFMGKAACGTCHFPPTFNGLVPPFYIDTESEVLGVTADFDSLNPILDKDLGRYANGLKNEAYQHYKHSFKTVGLRNVELTAPYMHNGQFETLEEVLAFYNLGGGAGMGLDISNQTLSDGRLDLSQSEISDIISFLHTLSDTTNLSPGKIQLPKFENQPYWNHRDRPIILD